MALVVLALVAGVALRFARLDHRSFWLDEAYSVEVARAPLAEILAGRAGDAHTPPLYYALLHGWMRMGDSDAWLRSFSALASCLVLLLACLVPARLWPYPETKSWVLVLIALSPFQVYFAQEARMYSLATALAVAVFLLEHAASRGGRWPVHVGLVVAGVLGMYCHYYLAFVIAGSAAWRGWGLWRRSATCDRPVTWWAVHLAMVVAFVPWLGVVVELVGSGGQTFRSMMWAVPGYAVTRFLVGYGVMPHDTTLESQPLAAVLAAWPWLVAVAAVGALSLVGLARLARRDAVPAGADLVTHAAVVLGSVFGLPAILSLAVPMYSERYLGIAQPVFLLLVVIGLRAAPHRLAWGGLGAVLTLSILAAALWVGGWGGKERWRDAAALISAEARSGDRVLIDPAYTRVALARYLRRPDLTRVPVTRERPVADLGCQSRHLQAGERVWVTLSHASQTAETWQRAFASCAELDLRLEYPDGVGVTVLRFEAREPAARERSPRGP